MIYIMIVPIREKMNRSQKTVVKLLRVGIIEPEMLGTIVELVVLLIMLAPIIICSQRMFLTMLNDMARTRVMNDITTRMIVAATSDSLMTSLILFNHFQTKVVWG